MIIQNDENYIYFFLAFKRQKAFPRTRPDQDQKVLRNLGPDRTRTKKIEKSRTELDQDQEKFGNLGPDRTRTNKIKKSRTEPDQDQ